jgi:hypothetical protein
MMSTDATMEPVSSAGRQAPPSSVLGFAAPIEAGKTTLSIAVADRLRAPRVSFGEYLRWLAGERNLPVTREVLQDLGDQLVKRDVHDFCRGVLQRQPWRPGVPLVIDGVRHLEVLEALAEILAPAPGYLIYIKVDRATQAKRLLKDDLRHEKPLEELEQHPTERQVRSVLPDKAALVLDGTRPADELTMKVLEFLETKAGLLGAERDWGEKNTRRLELAEKKGTGDLDGAEVAEFDQLQTEYFDYLDAKYPRTPADLDRLVRIEARLKVSDPPSEGK